MTAYMSGVFLLIEVPADAVSAVVEGKPWGRLEVQLDGREADENGTLGCVGSLEVQQEGIRRKPPLAMADVQPLQIGQRPGAQAACALGPAIERPVVEHRKSPVGGFGEVQFHHLGA